MSLAIIPTSNVTQPIEQRRRNILPLVNDEARSISINEIVARMLSHFDGSIAGKTIAVWGATDLDFDIRSITQTMKVAKRLVNLGATVACHPSFLESIDVSGGAIKIVAKSHEALKGADALLILTSSGQYSGIAYDPGMLAWKMNEAVVFDVFGKLEERSLTLGGNVRYYDLQICSPNNSTNSNRVRTRVCM